MEAGQRATHLQTASVQLATAAQLPQGQYPSRLENSAPLVRHETLGMGGMGQAMQAFFRGCERHDRVRRLHGRGFHGQGENLRLDTGALYLQCLHASCYWVSHLPKHGLCCFLSVSLSRLHEGTLCRRDSCPGGILVLRRLARSIYDSPQDFHVHSAKNVCVYIYIYVCVYIYITMQHPMFTIHMALQSLISTVAQLGLESTREASLVPTLQLPLISATWLYYPHHGGSDEPTLQLSTYTTLHYNTLRYVTIRYVTLRYVTLHCIASHCIALHRMAEQTIA